MNIGIENYHPKNNQKTPYDWTISRDTDFNGLGDANEFINFCEKKGIKKINNKEEFFPLLEEYQNATKTQKHSASNFDVDDIDTNNNGKIEKSEMENFTDSLNDYMDKNKKGRDYIPVTTRR